jgi:hypothetical protein
MRKIVLLCLAISLGFVLPCLAQELVTENTRTINNRFKKPDPIFDIIAYGARAVSSIPTTTATMSKGSATAFLESGTSFQNGDGVTIYGAGDTNALSKPGAPKVTPSIAAGGTTTGIVIDSPTGRSTYSYKIVARDKYGALTAAGTATTISTGRAEIGLRTATITTALRAKDSVTVNTLEETTLVAGGLIHITGSSNPDFNGWFIVSTVNSKSQFVITETSIDSRGIGWKFGDSASSSGGRIAFYLSNHLKWAPVKEAWEYYIYGERPGDSSYKLIGQTKPSANAWIDAEFDDYGATFMANQTFPSYVPLTAPLSATNDPLTTTITAGEGTTRLTLAATATHSVSGSTILFDDEPAIFVAANASKAAGGTLYIPPSLGAFYPVSSFLLLPTDLNIKQSGTLALYETIEVQSNTDWFGDWSNGGVPQFGFAGTANVRVETANPGIYAYGNGIDTAYMSWESEGENGGTLWVVQDSVNAEWDYTNYVANNAGDSDYLSTNIVFRSTSTGGNNYHFRKTLFSGGPNQVTDKSWTPLVYFPPNQDGSGGPLGNQNYLLRCMECFLNRRGFEQEQAAGGGGRWEFDGGYRQGGITPLMAAGNSNGNVGGIFIFHNLFQDTEATGTLALYPNGGKVQATVESNFLYNPSSDTNGVPPPFTGQRINALLDVASTIGTISNRGSEIAAESNCAVTYPYATIGTHFCVTDPMKKIFETMDFPAKHSLFWDLPTPSGITAETATDGGSLAANTTYYYTASATGVDGGETVPATVAGSSTTTSSDRTIPVSWTGIAGAESYNVYRCTSLCVFSDGRIRNSGNWRLVDRTITTTRINDKGQGVGQGPPTATGTGSVGANATEVYAPAFVTVSPLANGKSYTATDTAPITADRIYAKPDQSGTYALDLTGSTSIITGTVLSASCSSGTASVAGAAVGMPVVVSTADGSDVGGAFDIRASVTRSGIVTVYVCGTGKPPSKAYNVRVIQ